MQKILSWVKHHVSLPVIILVSVIAGFLLLALIRFTFTKPPAETHYHANFQVYINGERETFEGPGYYEEVAACTDDNSSNIKARTHMHNNENDIIHVHDKRVTWQDFFTNIGWTVGPDFVRSTDTLYANSDDKQVTFVLNGQVVNRVDNKVIGDQDTLLVWYGAPTDDVMSQFSKIENKAKHEDEERDPSTCSGLNGTDSQTFSARLKRAFFSN